MKVVQRETFKMSGDPSKGKKSNSLPSIQDFMDGNKGGPATDPADDEDVMSDTERELRQERSAKIKKALYPTKFNVIGRRDVSISVSF